MEVNCTFDDFMRMICNEEEIQGLDQGNIKLTFNSVCTEKIIVNIC